MLKQLLVCGLALGVIATAFAAHHPHHNKPPAHPIPSPIYIAKPMPAPVSVAQPAPLPAPAADTPEAPPPPAPETVAHLDDVPGLTAFFDGIMRVSMERHHVTGAVMAVVKDGQVLLTKGYGKAELERGSPVDPAASLFRIGSITKLFTWTAVMELVDDGKLDLDQDVNTYLKTGTAHIPPAFGKPVTLRTLMTHTAGFEDASLGFLMQTDARRQLAIVEAMRRHMPERVRAPGEMSAYSNYGAALAGLIVEQVSGEPYNEFIEKRIFAPLGMLHSAVQEPVPDKIATGLTTAYRFVDGMEVPQPFEVVGGFRPAGSGSVSALDMTHFMLMHLGGGRYGERQLLAPESAQKMHSSAFKLDPRLPGMTLGFYEKDINGHEAIGHGGDTVNYHADMVLMPKQGFGFFVSFIGEDSHAREEVENAFFGRYFPRTTPASPRLDDTIARLLAAKYSGSYEWTRRNYSGFEKLLNLTQELDVAPMENGNLVVTGLGHEPVQFEPVASDLYRDVLHGEMQMAFRNNEAAQPTHMFFGNLPFMPAERTPWYEESSLWTALLVGAYLLFLAPLAALYFRWPEIQVMELPQQRAITASAVTAGWALVTALALGGVLASNSAATLLAQIPTSLTLALTMPIVFAALTAWLIYTTAQCWREGYWTLSRRITYTVTVLPALLLCVFFWQWHLLGWWFG